MSSRRFSTAGLPATAVLAMLAGSVLSNRAMAQSTEPFPAQFELSCLLPENGGDGRNGFVLYGIDANDRSGWSVSSAGDVNGDGIDDLIIGALNGDRSGNSGAGESYIVFGATDLGAGGVGTGGSFNLSELNGPNGFTLNGNRESDKSGSSVCSAGDVNGDGIDDLIIGAPRALTSGTSRAGVSYVVFGAADMGVGGVGTGGSFNLSPLNGSNGFFLRGIDADDKCGWSVASAGDVNGDGIDDLIIGAYRADPNGNSSAGESYVVFGAAELGIGGVGTDGWFNLSSLNGTNGFVLNGIDGKDGIGFADRSGNSVSSAGDVNGDGIDDLIIGAFLADPNGNPGAGESYVVFGAADLGAGGLGTGGSFNLSALNGTNGFVLNGVDAEDRSGSSVSSAGDVNGDGIDDLIIGANHARPYERDIAGEGYVVFGAADLGAGGAGNGGSFNLSALNGVNGIVLKGIDHEDSCGRSVSSAGDVNGDGIDDLIIGAYRADPNGLIGHGAGESYVVFGAADLGAGGVGTDGSFNLATLNGTNGFVLNGVDQFDYSGWSVSSAGDVNGDGIDDLIIGAFYADPNETDRAGESYVVFGRALPPCAADFNGDGVLDSHDIRAFVTLYRNGEMAADLNGDGSLSGHDIRLFISRYQDGCE